MFPQIAEVVNKGQIISAERENVASQMVTSVGLLVTTEMMPSFRVVAFYSIPWIGQEELVSDSVWIDVVDNCVGGVSSNFPICFLSPIPLFSESHYKEKLQRRCCKDGLRDIPMPYSCTRRSLYITEGPECILAFRYCCATYRDQNGVRAGRGHLDELHKLDQVRVVLMKTEGMCSVAFKERHTQEVTLPAGSSVAVPYTIVPLVVGKLPLEVMVVGRDMTGGDRIQKFLRVVVELESVVPNSVPETFINVRGNVLADSIDNSISEDSLASLIQMPGGCVEQNLASITLPLIATLYLDRTNNWESVGVDRRAEALRYIRRDTIFLSLLLQSTMVVLQALSEYMISQPPPADLSMKVDIRMTGRKEIRYYFNPDTAYVARSSKVSHKEPEILIFRLQQSFKVGLLQPSSVTVYEYYNPGVEAGVEVGQKRFFMSHGGCRGGLNLKQGSQYLIISPKEDHWDTDPDNNR
ncbi:hypothetical protein XENOCAPTIV_028690 [Xenoophorus captivus]|uniref:Anaphylatoxin-like domain-containing protein n=1 Tax=Xenoophorus captivus TaxID=1517983 RepID=A0ABV0QNG6_9TELE